MPLKLADAPPLKPPKFTLRKVLYFCWATPADKFKYQVLVQPEGHLFAQPTGDFRVQ